MAYFAYCDWGPTIWQFDTAHPAQAPVPLHNAQDNLFSLAVTADAQFDMVYGSSVNNQISASQASGTDVLVYQSSGPGTEAGNYGICYVRVRNIPGEGERLYFSAYDGTQTDTDYTNIYYLKDGAAVLYTTIDAALITARTLCNPPVEVPSYCGDFAFGDNDTLYLSTGNLAGSVVLAGIYRIDGAGPDSAAGTPQRIYLGTGPIQGLYYSSPQTLYFLRDDSLIKLDLVTMTETTEGTLTVDPPGHAVDVVEIGAGAAQSAHSHLVTALYRSLTAMAHVLLLAARTMVSAGRPTPHPDPLRQRIPAFGPGAAQTGVRPAAPSP